MKTTTAPFQSAALLAPPRTLQFTVAGAPVRIAWTTPTQWWIMLGVVLFAGVLFVFSVRHAVDEREAAFRTIATDCAPSIIAAQRLRTSLADYDANLTNELLCAPGSPDMARAMQSARERRHDFTDNLLAAAAKITFADAERLPMRTMANELGEYETVMARAQTLQEKGDRPGALATFREASRRMHKVILPAANALDAANGRVLDETYAAQHTKSLEARGWMALAGMLYLGSLAAAQWLLWRMTRRRINLGLLAAAFLTACFALYGAAASLRSARQLKVATKDALDSVRYLWNARAVAYDANGDESRWLFDRDQAAGYAREFSEKAALVASSPTNISLQNIGEGALASSYYRPPEVFRGFLAQELGNITFTGERDAAARTIRAFGNYLDVDKSIRRLEASGRHDAAVALCLSYGPGGSNAVFAEFDTALGSVLDINATAFTESSREGIGDLRLFDYLIPVYAVAAALAVFGGFWPRLKEYAV